MAARRLAVGVLIAALAAGSAHVLTTLRFFHGIFGAAEESTVDYRVRSDWRGQVDSTGIVLVLFDSASVAEWPYLSPFPRAALAELVETAAANGAAAIGLDVYLDRLYPVLSAQDSGDARLRRAIERAGNVVLVAPTQGPAGARRLLPPAGYFAEVARAVGTADLPTAMDVLRHTSLVTRTVDGLVPGFALALWAVGTGRDLGGVLAEAERTGRLELAGLPERHARLPATGAVPVPIRFEGPPSSPEYEGGAFPAMSASAVQVLGSLSPDRRHEILSSWLSGRIVLLGSGFHESERFRTAFYQEVRQDSPHRGEVYGWMYGVEAHANALQNLLTGSFMQPVGAAGALLLLLVCAGLAAAATFWRGARTGALVALATFVAAWFGVLEAYERAHLVLPVIAPGLALALSYTGSAAWVSIFEGREKRLIRGAFARYVPPMVVDELVADPSRLRLGGEKRHISILFSDVAGFTSMSEALAPELLVAVLNEYLDEMSAIVLEEGGTLDKYIGDAIMALYGAPAALPGHELHACRTALRMQRRLAALNAEWRVAGRNWPELRIRIGINTGTPVVGNIGGEKRFDYTALGDAVNLAARLEPACKMYGVAILLAEETRRGAGDGIVVRELDWLAVYGKAEPVTVYELVSLAGEGLEAGRAELLQLYERGLESYRGRDFELALRYFEAALELDPADGPARLYRERSAGYLAAPPAADWDFVERRQVK